jgi:catechol 2,3-dioxygenase-like lactoylglutathione lyase family enzyme
VQFILPRMKKALAVLIVLIVLVTTSAVAQDAKRPAITGIAYVRIYAKDMAASQKFYTKELLLPEAKCAAKDCMRFQVGKDQFVEVVKAGANERDGMQVVAFRTADAEGLRKYLAAHQVKVPGSVRNSADGAEFEITDPEGHRIAFLQLAGQSDEQGVISHRMIHAGFIVKSAANMDPLYKDVLGFRPYWHGGMKDGQTDWVSLQVPDGTDWIEYMLNVGPDPSHHLVGVMNHFSLGVVNMDETEAALEKTGWKPHGEEHKQLGKDGKMQLNVFDPDEVRVEFMNFKPSEKPCCSEFTGPQPSE